MRRIKKLVEYTPEITIDQIMAFRSDKPETHTPIEFINKICAFLEKNPRVLAGGQLHEYLGMESKHLAYTLEVLTGFQTTDFRAEIIARRWHELKQAHPDWKEMQISAALGFTDYSVMWQFIERHKRCFPEMFLDEEETKNRIKVLVEELMKTEDAMVRRLYIGLPFKGGAAEEEACLRLLYGHSARIADLALEIAARHPEIDFGYKPFLIRIAALLHNIGIVWTDTPALHCHGKEPYVVHGELGSHWLSRKGHGWAMYCASSHIGSGITDDEPIKSKNPILFDTTPKRPLDKLICYASSFYSVFKPEHKRTLEEIRADLAQYGDAAVKRFDEFHRLFG